MSGSQWDLMDQIYIMKVLVYLAIGTFVAMPVGGIVITLLGMSGKGKFVDM